MTMLTIKMLTMIMLTLMMDRVVPGARERLVQITGPALENILQVKIVIITRPTTNTIIITSSIIITIISITMTQAKSLIEDTIRRNQSPLPREEVRL